MGGLGGGHYTAYARVGEKWLSFDDSSVDTVSPTRLGNSSSKSLCFLLSFLTRFFFLTRLFRCLCVVLCATRRASQPSSDQQNHREETRSERLNPLESLRCNVLFTTTIQFLFCAEEYKLIFFLIFFDEKKKPSSSCCLPHVACRGSEGR